MIARLLKASLNPDLRSLPAACGHLILRVGAGLMIFYIHGWHKLAGWIAYLQHGTPWKLAEEVAEMHFPAPLASAVAATGVQFVCSLFLIIGLFTRLNAALLTGVLGVAILQNLLAARDAQLATLYTLIVLTLALLGGGRFALDAPLNRRTQTTGESL
jgi:putative oxidoreductase